MGIGADLESGSPAGDFDDGAGKAGLRQPVQRAFHRCIITPIGSVGTRPVTERAIAIGYGGGAPVKGHINDKAVTIDIRHPVQTARLPITILGKGAGVAVGVEHVVGSVGIGVGVGRINARQVHAEINPALFDIVDLIDAGDDLTKIILVNGDRKAVEVQTITTVDRQRHQVVHANKWFVAGSGNATGAHGFVA